MVSQETQDFILTVVDANQEYNTKLLVLCLFFLYLVFGLWFANRLIPFNATRDQRSKFPIYQQVSVKLIRVVSVAFIAFYLLIMPIFMYRDYDIDSLITLMITGYSLATMVGLGIWFLFGMDWVQDLLALVGIQTKDTKGTLIRRKD